MIKIKYLFFCFFISIFAINISGCINLKSNKKYPETVHYVDKANFIGTWYEIASTPNFYNGGCSCSKGEYSTKRDPNKFKIVHSCFKNHKNKWEKESGTAKIVKNSGNAKLKISFFWPFYYSYWIIYVSDDYNYAILAKPDLSYSIIMSKFSNISKTKLHELFHIAKSKGSNIKGMKVIKQNCNN